MKNSYKEIDSIDLLKIIACIFILLIHADAFADISPLFNRLFVEGLGRLAVPLFFLITSFFFFRGNCCKESVTKYLKRIGRLYLCWFILAFPITIFNHFFVNENPFLLNLFLLVKSFFFTSTFTGSWFLTSCAFCVVLFYCLGKLGPYEKITTLFLAVLAYLICVCTSAYGKIMDILGLRDVYNSIVFFFAKPYLSIIVGIPYFALGKFISKNESVIKKPNPIIFLSLLCLLFIEVYCTYTLSLANYTDCYLFLLPVAYCIFLYFLKWNISINYAYIFRKSSIIIFLSHSIFLFVIEFIEWLTNVTISRIEKFLLTLGMCVLLSYLIMHIQKYRKMSFLKILY